MAVMFYLLDLKKGLEKQVRLWLSSKEHSVQVKVDPQQQQKPWTPKRAPTTAH